MKIVLVTPAPRGARNGNRVTALRWSLLLRQLGHGTRIIESQDSIDTSSLSTADVLVALHALRSAPAIQVFRRTWPTRPVVVALTGTDLYLDSPRAPDVRRSLDAATRLVALQPAALESIPKEHRDKTRIILQSARPLGRRQPLPGASFDACVVANLREVKDPLRAAAAARLLPASSKVRVIHIGEALDPALRDAAQREMASNSRYVWSGAQTRHETLDQIARSSVVIISSRAEGGSNVLSEAVVSGVPVIASRIPGLVGNLGDDYPGLFPHGDESALAALLSRCEADAAFYADLAARCAQLAMRYEPAREREAWRELLAGLFKSKAERATVKPAAS